MFSHIHGRPTYRHNFGLHTVCKNMLDKLTKSFTNHSVNHYNCPYRECLMFSVAHVPVDHRRGQPADDQSQTWPRASVVQRRTDGHRVLQLRSGGADVSVSRERQLYVRVVHLPRSHRVSRSGACYSRCNSVKYFKCAYIGTILSLTLPSCRNHELFYFMVFR